MGQDDRKSPSNKVLQKTPDGAKKRTVRRGKPAPGAVDASGSDAIAPKVIAAGPGVGETDALKTGVGETDALKTGAGETDALKTGTGETSALKTSGEAKSNLSSSAPQGIDLHDGFLAGRLLFAAPSMTDPRFEKSVIYLCSHSEKGAMGLIVNRLLKTLDFDELLSQLSIEQTDAFQGVRVHFGGPVEMGRGFVLHSGDYCEEGTVQSGDGLGVTATLDILHKTAKGEGPKDLLFALGYAGWGAGQLDREVANHDWMIAPLDTGVIFDNNDGSKWSRCMARFGASALSLSTTTGHA